MNTQDFFTNLVNAIPSLTNDYANIVAVNNQNKLGSVLTNPNTTAGKVYTTGQAFNASSSYTIYIVLAVIALVLIMLFR